MEEKITTIDRVRFDGKWVEFWFTDGQIVNGLPYDASTKAYRLWGAIEDAGIYDEVISTGLKGRKLKWVKVGVNYEINSFII